MAFHRFSAAVALAPLLVLAGFAITPAVRAQDPVPEQYQETYLALEQRLKAFHRYLDSIHLGRAGKLAFGAELSTADGHRGEALLTQESALTNYLMVNRLKGMGLDGVTISINYPMLNKDFPHSSEYLSFYKQLAKVIRDGGLRLHVTIAPIAPGAEYTDLAVDYANLDKAGYFARWRAMCETVAREIRPDMLTVAGDPAAWMKILGIRFTPEELAAYVDDAATAARAAFASSGRGAFEGSRKKGPNHVLICAGAGTWENPAYIEELIDATKVDIIDLHLYALEGPGGDYLKEAVRLGKLAKRKQKRLIIGEFWLYKTTAAELAKHPVESAAFGIDAYDFWAPLDIAMIRVVAKMARRLDVEYVSLRWTKYLFGYLEYNKDTKDLPVRNLMAESSRVAARGMNANRRSSTGEIYWRIVNGREPY